MYEKLECEKNKHCMAKILCNPPAIDCFMKECPRDPAIREILQRCFQENMIEKVTLRQWISVDRCSLESLQKPSAEFIELFCSKLEVLIRHAFIAKQKLLSLTK